MPKDFYKNLIPGAFIATFYESAGHKHVRQEFDKAIWRITETKHKPVDRLYIKAEGVNNSNVLEAILNPNFSFFSWTSSINEEKTSGSPQMVNWFTVDKADALLIEKDFENYSKAQKVYESSLRYLFEKPSH